MRLKQLVGQSGGVSAREALQGASERLDDIRDDCLNAIDHKIELVRGLANATDEQSRSRCYSLSNEIFAEAGAFGLHELSAAAHSLCALIAAADHAPIPASAVIVHANALRLLRLPEDADSKQTRGALLRELRAMTTRLSSAR